MYDDDPNTTTTVKLRLLYRQRAEENQSFHELLEMLYSRSEDEALVILQRVRAGSNVQSTLQHVKAGYVLAHPCMTGTDDVRSDDILFTSRSNTREETMLIVNHRVGRPPRSLPVPPTLRGDSIHPWL
ncbi:hypothetical protein PG999_005460 [Apiospora kogelbergensis]|uniref:Uncharacterized protein n=1 Tax=Apiospora kogelbergensis TaxID=1337665 RepID=A0AAW0QTV4_9PEZI